tara:strand:+ start:6336 stop:6653 length:318 start_codon:yes stop_codon:yes gene_type:complete
MKKIYQEIFIIGTNLTYVLYIFALFSISSYAPKYLDMLKTFLKYYISILLIILFNPITGKKQFGDFERRIAYSAGIFLLLSSALLGSIESTIQQESKEFINYIFY